MHTMWIESQALTTCGNSLFDVNSSIKINIVTNANKKPKSNLIAFRFFTAYIS